VEAQRRNRERVVEIRRRAGKLREIVTSSGSRFLVLKGPRTDRLLRAGVELGDAEIELLEGPYAAEAGLARALRLLAVRDRSEREIRETLAGEGIGRSDIIDEIIGKLAGQGYIDDRRLAANYIGFMTSRRPSGPHLLRRKLIRAGVEKSVVDEEIRAALPPERERELALELALGKLAPGLERDRVVRRIHAFLSRRGFSSDVVNDICARILRGTGYREGDEREHQERS
jgi:regulatory protein